MKAFDKSQRYLGWKECAGCVQEGQSVMEMASYLSALDCRKVVTSGLAYLRAHHCTGNHAAERSGPKFINESLDKVFSRSWLIS